MDPGVLLQDNIMTESEFLRIIAQIHQNKIAESMELSTTYINGIVAGEKGITLARLGPFLNSLGLVCLTKEKHNAILLFARQALEKETENQK